MPVALTPQIDESQIAFDREDATFKVLVNAHEQYSLWPDYKAMPAGWCEAGKSGAPSV